MIFTINRTLGISSFEPVESLLADATSDKPTAPAFGGLALRYRESATPTLLRLPPLTRKERHQPKLPTTQMPLIRLLHLGSYVLTRRCYMNWLNRYGFALDKGSSVKSLRNKRE